MSHKYKKMLNIVHTIYLYPNRLLWYWLSQAQLSTCLSTRRSLSMLQLNSPNFSFFLAEARTWFVSLQLQLRVGIGQLYLACIGLKHSQGTAKADKPTNKHFNTWPDNSKFFRSLLKIYCIWLQQRWHNFRVLHWAKYSCSISVCFLMGLLLGIFFTLLYLYLYFYFYFYFYLLLDGE